MHPVGPDLTSFAELSHLALPHSARSSSSPSESVNRTAPTPRRAALAPMRFTSTLVVACLATLTAALPLQDSSSGPQIAFVGSPASPLQAGGAHSLPALSASIRSRPDIQAAVAALPLEHAVQLGQFIAGLTDEVRVSLGDDEEPVTMTEGEKALLTLTGTRFLDVTDEQLYLTTTVQGTPGSPRRLAQLCP